MCSCLEKSLHCKKKVFVSFVAAEIGYTHQQVRVFEMASRTPGQSPTHQMLSDWQSKNPTAQDLHDKLHKINRRREMQILEA